MRTFLITAFAVASFPAFAHVTLVAGNAAPGALYDAQFRVGHGCSGSPTTGLRIEIPAAIVSVDPLAVPGWTIAREKDGAGRITALRYAGGSVPADRAGAFTVRLRLPKAPGKLVFAVHQTCAQGGEDWTGAAGSAHPAPVLTVGEKAKPESAMGGMEMKSMPGMQP